MYLVQMATFDFQLEELSPEEKREMRRAKSLNIRRTIVPLMESKVLRYEISPNSRVCAEEASKKALAEADAWARERRIEHQEYI